MASSKENVSVLVEYEYLAEQDDELTLKPGDIVTDVNIMDGGWWEGTLGGKRGVFPDNFVKKIDKHKPPEKRKPKHPFPKPPVDSEPRKPTKGPSAPVELRPGREAKKKWRARVTYSYTPQNEDELGLKVGEVIEVTNQEEDGWWEGVVDGNKGVFPSNFVDLITDDKDEDFKEIKGKKIKGIGFGDIFAGGVPKLKPKTQGSGDGEITSPPIITGGVPKLKPKRQGSDGEMTTSPPILNSVENRPHLPVKQNDAPPPVPREPPPPYRPVEHAKVLYPYNAENEDELNLEEGEIIDILDKELEDSGWWKGSINGRTGVFPDNFVELIQPEEKPRRPAPPMPVGKPRMNLPEPDKVEQKDDKNKKDSVKKAGPPPLGKKPGKNADAKLLSQTDDHKAQEQQSESAEPNPKLKHMTKDRPRPPSNRQPPATASIKSPKEIPARPIPSHQTNSIQDTGSGTTSPRRPVTPPTTEKKDVPEKPIAVPAATSNDIDQLRKELRELKANTVSKQQYHNLQEQMEQLKHKLDDMKTQFDKRLYGVMVEVDEEKKLRLSMQIEVERIKKLVAPS